jgi:hypothetical protein
MCNVRATYSKHTFLSIPICKRFTNDLKNLQDTQTQCILNIYRWNFLVEHVLAGVNPRGRCAIVTPLPQIGKASPKNHKTTGSRFVELI